MCLFTLAICKFFFFFQAEDGIRDSNGWDSYAAAPVPRSPGRCMCIALLAIHIRYVLNCGNFSIQEGSLPKHPRKFIEIFFPSVMSLRTESPASSEREKSLGEILV